MIQTAEQNRKQKQKAGGKSLKQAAADESQRRGVLADGDSSWSPLRRTPEEAAAAATRVDRASEAVEAKRIPIARIEVTNANPRTTFEEEKIAELAAQLADVGLTNPIAVRLIDTATDSYELIAGERRLRAAKALGWTTIPAVVKECSDAEAVMIRGGENLGRVDLNPIEEAVAYQQMLGTGLTQEQLATRLGVAQPTIANRLRLLKLPATWQDKIASGRLSASVGREFVPYVGHAKLLKALEQELFPKAGRNDDDEPAPVTTRDVPNVLRWAVQDVGVKLNDETWCSPAGKHVKWSVELTEEQRKRLAVVEVPDHAGRPQWWATAETKEAEKLANAAMTAAMDEAERKAKAKAAGEKASSTRPTGTAAAAKPSPADERRKRDERAKQVERYARRFRDDWLRPLIAARLTQRQAMRLMFWWFAQIGRSPPLDCWPFHGLGLAERRDLLFAGANLPSPKGGHFAGVERGDESLLGWCSTLASLSIVEEMERLDKTALVIARGCLVDAHGKPRPWIPSPLLDALSIELKLDEAKAWTLTEGFLGYFTKEELLEFADAVGCGHLKATQPKGEMIDALILTAPSYMPKCVHHPRAAELAAEGATRKGGKGAKR